MRENDILFFNLHRRYLNYQPSYGGFLGIYMLAAFLNKNGYAAQSYAGSLVEGKQLIDEACQNQKVGMIDLYCDYENVTENMFLCRYIKETYGIPVVCGGPQATALGKEFFEKSHCDAVGVYEGELTVLETVDYFLDGIGELDQIQGLVFYRDGELVHTPLRPVIQNLDALPFIDSECYLVPERQRYNELSIMTGRGCPFHCAFCHEGSHTRQVRFRSIPNVLQEIDLFLDKLPPQGEAYVMFTDDTFTLQPQRVKELCGELKKRQQKKRFNWFCEGHVHMLYTHPEMIQYIADGGAQRLQLGIEAGTQEVLDAYRKGSTLDEIRTVVAACRDAGIEQIFSNIILAGAHYSRDVYEKNIAFAKELISLGKGCVEIGVVSFWPLAQTSMTLHPEAYDLRIIDDQFLTACGDFPQVETKDLTRWDILRMVRDMSLELRAHMVGMLRRNEVPRKLIFSWFPQEGSSRAQGQWWQILTAEEELCSYYAMLHTGEAVSSDELSIDMLEAHPMRVLALDHNTTVIDNGTMEIKGCRLTGLERDVLILATGKLSVQDMLAYIAEHQQIPNDEALRKFVVTTLQKLESYHLVVFSLY